MSDVIPSRFPTAFLLKVNVCSAILELMNTTLLTKSIFWHQIDFCLNSPNCQSWDFFFQIHITGRIFLLAELYVVLVELFLKDDYWQTEHSIPWCCMRFRQQGTTLTTLPKQNSSPNSSFNLNLYFLLKKLVLLFARPTYLFLSVTQFKRGW